MKVAELQNDQVVRVRVGMAERYGVEWREWQLRPVSIQKNKKNETVIIALQGLGWAEYNPKEDYQGKGLFTAEDYYMEIDGLE
jgi:hypothetical protein